MLPRRLSAVTLIVAVGACVSPTRSYDQFEDKLAVGAETALSAVATTRKTVNLALEQGAFAPYLSVLAEDAEEEISEVDSEVAAIQPPDARSDQLREALGSILGPAADAIERTRILLKREELDALDSLRGPLGQSIERLERFLREHPA